MRIVEGEWNITRVDTYPRIVAIELTTRCNLSCVHCFRNTMTDPRDDMPKELAFRVLDNAKDINIERVVFTGFGEPLVHPYIEDILTYAKKKGLYVVLNTNGTLLDKHLETVFNTVDTLIVSVDISEDSVYREIRRGGSLASIVEAIKKLVDMKRRYRSSRPVIEFWTTLTRLNVDGISGLVDLCRKLGVLRLTISNYIPTKVNDELSCLDDPRCIERAKQNISEIAKTLFDSTPQLSYVGHRIRSDRRCPYISNLATFVRFDGYVTPCMHYAHSWRFVFNNVERAIRPVIFGSIARQRLEEIWSNDRYAMFRFNTYFMLYPSCYTCDLEPYCSYTYDNEFDCLGKSPTCAHCPYAHRLAICPL